VSLKNSIIFALTSLSIGCISFGASGTESPTGQKWQSEHYRDHELVGKIWSSREKTFVSREQLSSSVKAARYVLLGETHTNKDHHLLQAQLLEIVAKAAQDRPSLSPRLVVEMIPQRFGKAVSEFQQAQPHNTDKLGDVLEWEKRGWGSWKNYQPIFDTALRYKLSIIPGNLNRTDTRKIGRKGVKAIDQGLRDKLSLDVPYTKAQSDLLRDMLFESHCKMVPKEALSPMQNVQQARDGIMAYGLLGAAKGSTGVLIAGSGHIRQDWAVPRILKAQEPDNTIVTVSFVEVAPDQGKPQDYEPVSADGSPVFDYLYFTPKSEIKDHCAELKKRFKKLKTK